MAFLSNLINAIVTPIRTLFDWFMRLVPGFRALVQLSLPWRVALTCLLFQLIVLGAAIATYLSNKDNIWLPGWKWGSILLPFFFVIPFLAYIITKLMMEKEESRFPDIDKAWSKGLEALKSQGILLGETPLFLVIGSPCHESTANLIKASKISFAVDQSSGESAPLYWFGSREGTFLFINDCCSISKLASNRGKSSVNLASPGGNAGGAPQGYMGTIVAGAGGNPVAQGAPAANPAMATLVGHAPAPSEPSAPSGANTPMATMQLPFGANPLDFATGGAKSATAVATAQLSAQESAEQIERLSYVCDLVRRVRYPVCPMNGLLSVIPFDLIESSSSQVQIAVQKDLATLREKLQLRCPAMVLVNEMEREEEEGGFRELINRVGAERAAEQRFGKGSEVWGSPFDKRLSAIATHATGSFEDWIYMLFQEENSLKRRHNSRLFSLLCRTRGTFAKSLEALLAKAYGFDPATQPELARSQFLFGGCYFAATGSEPERQAFVKSVLVKMMQQDGEIEWAPSALEQDRQLQFSANLVTLIGIAAVLAIVAMVVIRFVPLGN